MCRLSPCAIGLAVVRAALVVMLRVGLAIAAYADVYSWTDEDGVIHFTNIKPSGGKWKKVLDSLPRRVATHSPLLASRSP
jgi:hypothetical protein